jgi:hypothetical protein
MRSGSVTALVAALAIGLGGSALAPAAHAAPTPAQAQSIQVAGFNAAGTWDEFQNNSYNATLTVAQDALGNLSGSAAQSDGIGIGTIAQGFVDGSYIYFVINWTDGRQGRYIGSLQADHTLSGVSTDLAHPSSQAAWSTTSTF